MASAETEYLGGKSIGGLMPSTLAGLLAGEAAINATLPSAEAELAGTLSAQASLEVSTPAAIIDLATEIAASASISPPAVSVNASFMADAVAELQAEVGALQAALSLIVQLLIPFGTAGIHAYLVEGGIGAMGSALQLRLAGGVPGGSGGEQLGTGIFLVAADNGAAATLRQLFAT